jgi:hypothetical protein
MLWDLALRLTGQLRSATGGDRLVVTGLDMASSLALATGLGIPARLAAEFLPEIERALVAALNDTGDDAPSEGEFADV